MEGAITYTTKTSSRSRQIRIAVHRDGRVVVTKPQGVPQRFVDDFVQSKAAWIAARLNEGEKRRDPDLHATSDYHYRLHKAAARSVAEEKLEQWNAHYQFDFLKVDIRKMTSRWGSCSSAKRLCFNYKIVFLREELQDYLVVHELCHLAEMNHSDRFWARVAEAIPNYKELAQELRNI